jgi:hypothetical protein
VFEITKRDNAHGGELARDGAGNPTGWARGASSSGSECARKHQLGPIAAPSSTGASLQRTQCSWRCVCASRTLDLRVFIPPPAHASTCSLIDEEIIELLRSGAEVAAFVLGVSVSRPLIRRSSIWTDKMMADKRIRVLQEWTVFRWPRTVTFSTLIDGPDQTVTTGVATAQRQPDGALGQCQIANSRRSPLQQDLALLRNSPSSIN